MKGNGILDKEEPWEGMGERENESVNPLLSSPPLSFIELERGNESSLG